MKSHEKIDRIIGKCPIKLKQLEFDMCVGWCLMYFRVKISLIAEYLFFVGVVIHNVFA